MEGDDGAPKGQVSPSLKELKRWLRKQLHQSAGTGQGLSPLPTPQCSLAQSLY